MIAADARVHWHCQQCSARGHADLPAIAIAKGEAYSLWDVICRCRACPHGLVTFGAAYRPGNWVFPLRTEKGRAKLEAACHDAWLNSRRK